MQLRFATPRERLVLTSTAMLLGGLLVLSTIALITLHGVVRGSLDTRLTVTAEALEALADYGKYDLHLDAADIRQFNHTLTLQVNGAIFGRSGATLMSSASSIPADITKFVSRPGSTDSFESLGQGVDQLRVYIRPVIHGGMRFGTIVVWRPEEWLREMEGAVLWTLVGAILTIGVLGTVIIDKVSRHALNDALERQRRFTADASHELRTPLSVIRAETDLAIENGCSSTGCRDALRSIQREANRMTILIDDMLAIARAEADRRMRGTIDISALCETVCQRLLPISAERCVALACHTEGPIFVEGDEASFTCAVAALVQNAIKYAPRYGSVAVRVRVADHRGEVLVCDNGVGFSATAIVRGFERFWRDDEVRARAAGYGLGLAIAKSIIDAFDGRIELSNAPGGGAQVRCVLPLTTKNPTRPAAHLSTGGRVELPLGRIDVRN